MSPLFSTLLDLGPIAAFFVLFKRYDLMVATAALVVLSIIAIAIRYAKERKLHPAPIVTVVVVALFGGLTLVFQDELFIKLKPTIVNLLFAAVLLIGAYGFNKAMLKPLMGMVLQLQDAGWKLLSIRWGYFFIFLAVVNEVVWRNFSTDFWVSFKLFGMMTLTLLFTFAQIPMMQRYGVKEESKQEPTDISS